MQETYLRAWRGFDRFEGRSSLRRWLYKIATMACLTALETRARRPLPSGLGRAVGRPRVAVAPRERAVAWLQPVPDALLGTDDPSAIVVAAGAVRLAFVAALQLLSGTSARRADAARRAGVPDGRGRRDAGHHDGGRRQRAASRAGPPAPGRTGRRTTWPSRTRRPGRPSSSATSTRSPAPTPARWWTCCGPTSRWRCRRSRRGSPGGRPSSVSWPVASCATGTSGTWCPPAPTASPPSSSGGAGRPARGVRHPGARP